MVALGATIHEFADEGWVKEVKAPTAGSVIEGGVLVDGRTKSDHDGV